MSLRLSFALAAALAAGNLGCGEDVSPPPGPLVDAGIECVTGSEAMDGSAAVRAVACPEGQVCVGSRCYERCSSDAQCGAREQCGSAGACVPRTTPRPDGGGVDASTDPCELVMCDPAQACHPLAGTCVECVGRDQCGGGTPLCDRGFGRCTTFNARPCAPCETDRDCEDSAAGSVGSCLETDRAYEQVCVPGCGPMGECPAGLICDGARCLPHAISCTAFLAAQDARPCLADGECVPVGNVPAAGQCEGAMPTVDPPVPGRCLQPCGLPSHCPGGLTCVDGFCRPL